MKGMYGGITVMKAMYGGIRVMKAMYGGITVMKAMYGGITVMKAMYGGITVMKAMYGGIRVTVSKAVLEIYFFRNTQLLTCTYMLRAGCFDAKVFVNCLEVTLVSS